jgi:hypothetical protein
MAILGPRALIDFAIPTGVDGAEIFRFEMQDGMTPQEVIQLAATVMGEANQELAQAYGGLTVITERMWARHRQGEGSRTMTPLASEFDGPDGVRSDKLGHMLPILPFTDATAWSVAYLKKANREDIRDDLDLIRERWRNRIDFDLITRLLSKRENPIGDTGYDVPWAVGSGTNVNYIPPQWRAYIFDANHTHFKKTNAAISSANAATTLTNAAKELAHHGHSGLKTAMVSEADIDTYMGMDAKRFAAKKPGAFQAVTGGSSPLMVIEGEMQGIPGEIFGWFHTNYGMIELRYHERIPATYGWVGKSYGVNNPANPLAIRTPSSQGFGMTVNPQIDRSIKPKLDRMLFEGEHGVGVNDRTNGVAFQIASTGADYDEPTIS